MRGLPQLVLWAWERPEDLRFINPQTTAVGFLVDTIDLRGDTVTASPRGNRFGFRIAPIWSQWLVSRPIKMLLSTAVISSKPRL